MKIPQSQIVSSELYDFLMATSEATGCLESLAGVLATHFPNNKDFSDVVAAIAARLETTRKAFFPHDVVGCLEDKQ